VNLTFVNICGDRSLRVQRKDKRGKLGVKLKLEDVPPRGSIVMKAESANRFKIWFIDSNQSQLAGTRHIKLNIGAPLPTRDLELSVGSNGDRWPSLYLRGAHGAYDLGNNFTIYR
jgi:hypothetical protein